MPRQYLISLLLAMVLGSALTVIYVKHQSRVLFADLREIQKKQEEWRAMWPSWIFDKNEK